MGSSIENPRGYQSEILQHARNTNTIAFLETGAGKTLVSALLIRDILEQQSSRGKIAVFVVEKVALVHQQAEYMQEVSGNRFRVGTYYGSMGLDDWSIERWIEEMSQKRILVLTAQIFLNALNHARIDMKTIAVLVFDEVHHATGEHPFRRIMVDFYHTLPKELRPRVFGMTASPVKKGLTKSVEECAISIAVLEVTMDAKIFDISVESQEELESVVPNAFEFVALYAVPDNSEEYQDLEELKEDELAMKSGLDALVPSLVPSSGTINARNDSANRKNPAKISKGSDAELDLLLKKVHFALGRYVATFLSNELADSSGNMQYKYGENSIRKRLSHGPFISDHVRVLLDVIFQEARRWKTENANSNEQFRCIVFVHQRLFAFAVAWIINNILKSEKLNESCFEARAVVGCHAKSSHLRMSQSQQNDVLNDFRTGEFGVLVATNVVEEGLDIPACSVVIAFDPVLSAKSYIQARGRARCPGSHYIVMLPRGRSNHLDFLQRAYEGAKFMKETVKEMNATAASEWRTKLVEEAKKSIETANQIVLLSKETSARVYPIRAPCLLNRYTCGLQESGRKVEPEYEICCTNEGFVATVELPELSPIRFASSSPQASENLARQIAAFNAYSKLYDAGEIDHYLLPILKFVRKPAADMPRFRGTKGPRLGETVRQCTVVHPKPLRRMTRILEDTEEELVDETLRTLYLYCIRRQQEPSDEVYPEKWRNAKFYGVLVENRIDDDDLEAVVCPTGEPLLTLEYVGTMDWNCEQRDVCRSYMHVVEGCVRGRLPKWLSNLGDEPEIESSASTTLDAEFESGSSKDRESPEGEDDAATERSETATEADDEEKVFKTKFIRKQEQKIQRDELRRDQPPGFYYVPLVQLEDGAFDVDWQSVLVLKDFKVDRYGPRTVTDDWTSTFAVSNHETSDRIYFIRNEMEGVKPSSKSSTTTRRSLRYPSVSDYYLKRHGIDLSAEKDDLLESYGAHEVVLLKGRPFKLCRATCYHIPLSPWAAYTAALLPSWQTYLVLKDAWRKICQNRSLNFLSFSRCVQPNMGSCAREAPELNYERNEFLGDAVLKVVSSMMAYLKAPGGDEGLLTDYRDDEIANDNLCNIAVQAGIHNCIAFTGITPKPRKWEWFWGIPQISKHDFSEKVLADCIEANIGAHYLEGGFASAVNFMDCLEVVPEAEKILNGFKYKYLSCSDVDEKSRLKRMKDPRIAKVEKILGYSFKSKDIVVEALTHGSYASGKVQSYQRLEFLGDAVVGFILLSKYFVENTSLPPGDLSALSDPLLSNESFARVVVQHGLHEMLWLDCDALERDIRIFAMKLENEKDGEDVCKEQTVPKALGDIFESLIGAIVVDQEMRLDGIEDIVVRLMQTIVEQYANPESIDQHPVTQLGQRIQAMHRVAPLWVIEEVKNVDVDNQVARTGVRICRGMGKRNNQPVLHRCKVVVHGEVLGTAVGPTSRVAKHRASILSLKALNDAE